MQATNSFELYARNPNINSDFPFLALDINNETCVPKRPHFHEIHWHDDLQITYVLKGSIKISSLQKTIILQENQAVFINKNILHKITDTQDSHYRSFLFPDNLVSFYKDSAMNKQINQLIENNKIEFINIDDETTIQYLKQLNHITYNHPQNKEYTICMLLISIMNQLINNIPETHYSHINLNVQQCLVYIHKHYEDDITLKDIADYGNMSVGHLGRLFKSILDTTPYEYLIDYRIQKSLDLLSKKENTISDIAIKVGFNSVSYYIQCFKKRLSITPKQYQKQLLRGTK